jgi:threonine dehydratase
VRPAANAIRVLMNAMGGNKDVLQASGVCTASAGNFAQGLAWCCSEEGVPCTVIAPDHAPQSKLSEIIRRGAVVKTVPFSEWWEIIVTHRCPQAPGAHFIHPGADNAVLAGNATIAKEILEDLPGVDCIIAPYGSGALCTGIACGVDAMGHKEKCRVVSVEPETAAPFALSMRNGYPTPFHEYTPSFVDGCGGKGVLEEMWPLASTLIDEAQSVPLADIASAIRLLAERNKLIAEGAGACAVAAAMRGLGGISQAKKVVCVVSGAGLDTDKLVHILQGKGVPTDVPGARKGEALPNIPKDNGDDHSTHALKWFGKCSQLLIVPCGFYVFGEVCNILRRHYND